MLAATKHSTRYRSRSTDSAVAAGEVQAPGGYVGGSKLYGFGHWRSGQYASPEGDLRAFMAPVLMASGL